jgi:hypothetical protein
MDYSDLQEAHRLVVVGMLCSRGLTLFCHGIAIEFVHTLILFWFQVAEGVNPFKSNPGYVYVCQCIYLIF